MKPILSFFLSCFFICTLLAFEVSAQTAENQGKTAPEPPNNNVEELFQLGANLYRQGKSDEALAHFAKAARLSPQNFRAHVLLGITYQAQMKMKSASESFGTAIQLQPTDKRIYLMKATVDAERNAKEEALAACQKALEIDPAYTEAFAMIGQTLRWDEARRSEAIAAYQSALKSYPGYLAAYQPLADLLAQNKDTKGAEEIYRQGIAADPKKMNGRFAFGRMLVKQGRLAEARELWKGRTSDEDHTHPNFIVLLERAEKLKRATDALAQKPNDPAALVEMGLAVMDGDSWVVDGRQEKAREYFQQALKINPQYARAQYGICMGYIQLADTFDRHKKDVHQELEKLRRMDAALAKELEQYQKTFRGGLLGGKPVDFNK